MARIAADLAGLAGRTAADAQAVLRNARRGLGRVTGRARGQLRRAVEELAVMVEGPTTVVSQAPDDVFVDAAPESRL